MMIVVPAWRTMRRFFRISSFIVALFAGLASAAGQPSTISGDRLQVAVYTVAPYAEVDSTGKLVGHSVRLWELVAAELGKPFDLKPTTTVDAIVSGLKGGAFDIAIGALTVTSARETHVDFSYPTHPSGVAAATRKPSGFANAVNALGASLIELLPLLLLLTGLISLAGFMTWKIDERRSGSASDPKTIRSLGEGVYWATVTMTTVGYGDKAPMSGLARAFTIIWIFIGIVVISIFSGTVTAKLTATQLATQAGAETALRMKRLAAVRDSSGAEFLSMSHISFQSFSTLDAALSALAGGDVDAVFNSRGALVHLTATRHQDTVDVSTNDLTHGWMAFALPPGAASKEALNLALLNVLGSRAWAAEREKMARDYGTQGKPDRSTF